MHFTHIVHQVPPDIKVSLAAVFSLRLTMIPLGKDTSGSTKVSTEIRDLTLDHIVDDEDSLKSQSQSTTTEAGEVVKLTFLGWSESELKALNSREMLGLLCHDSVQHFQFHSLMSRGVVENSAVENWRMDTKNGDVSNSSVSLTTVHLRFYDSSDVDCYMRIMFQLSNVTYSRAREYPPGDQIFYSPILL
uniref:Uncharacterized protein n=1 Tax=Aureoumbra lagunensis TaxID=44058 RepID=A0A7S3JZ91_9STRA|mmetsp:Transcript_20627/g.26714  ORF Transcript_20627/g.26714 Transcript_20627/m.26714 type:complete len:190 (-) Transcript_20627:341-910(-)